jgi:uncharacterized membrane protein
MSRNESALDRAVRGAVSVVLVLVGLTVGVSTGTGIVLLVLAGILAVTAAVGFCPLYRLLNMSTLRLHRTRTPTTR